MVGIRWKWKRVLFGAGVVGAIASGGLMCGPTYAYAGDGNKDTPVHFDFTFYQTTAGAGERDKYNATSTYIYLDTIDINEVNLYVDGGPNNSNTPLVNCMGGADAVVTRHKEAKKPYCIRNLVYERFGASGIADAELTGWGKGNTGKVTGVWSPDSLRAYTPLNGYCNPDIW